MLRKMRLILLLSFVSLFAAAEVKAQTVKPQLTCSDSSGSATAQSCNTIIVLSGAGGAPGLFDVLLYTTGTTNTGDLTVAVNGGSAFHVRKNLGLSTLAAGDMPANTAVQLTFDGTYWETAAIGNTPGSLPSGTQGQPAVNTSGSNVYATSPLFLDASQFSGTNFGTTTCLTNADAVNGMCDGRAVGGSQTITAQQTVGDSSNTSGTVFYLPSKCLWNGSTVPNSSGLGAVLFQYGGTYIKSDNSGGASQCILNLTGASPTPAYMYSNNTGNGKYIRMDGVKFRNGSTGTTLSSGIDVFWDWTYDGSSTYNVAVLDTAGTPYLFENFASCCGTSHYQLNLNSSSVTGSTPLYIKGGSSQNEGINFYSLSADHAGSAKPDVLFDDPLHKSFVNFFGPYGESNATTPQSVCYNSLSGVQGANYFGLLINPIVAASTACAITIDNTFASGVTVVGGEFVNNGNMTFPATFVNNAQTGNTAATDAEGNIGFYTSSLSYFDAPVKMFNTLNAGVTTVTSLGTGTPPTACGSATGCIAMTEASTTGTPTAGVDYQRADSVTHSFLCSLNGGAEASCGGGASLAFPKTVSGTTTSGGIPYFSSTTVLTSSALLALKHVVLGGGAGGAPTSDSSLDDGATTANTLTYTGTAGIATPALTTNGSGAGLVALTAGAEGCVAGQPASSICFEAPATVGTAYHMLLPAAVGTSSQALTIASVTGQAVTLGFATVTGGSVFPVTVSGTVTSGGIPYFSSTTAETSSAILNTNILVKGGGAGGAPTNSSITDNGTTVSTAEAVTALSVAVGTSPPTCTIGTGGASCFNEGTAATGASAVDNIYANSTAHCLDVNYNNVEKGCLLAQPAGLVTIQTVTGADYTNATVTPSTVFSWTLPATAAAQNYKYTCDIMWESTAVTLVGPVFGLNISAAPTQLTGAASVQNTLAGADINGYLSNTTTGSQTLVTSTAAGVTSTNYWAKIWGTIEGSPTAGATFIINAASTSGTTASLNIRRGSSCKLEVIE